MVPASRRKLLRTIAMGTVPLGGCLGERGTTTTTGTPSTPTTARDSPAGTTTDTASGTPKAGSALDLGESYETEDGVTLTVEDVDVVKMIRSTSVGSSTHFDVACLDDAQFVVADASAVGSEGTSVLEDVVFALTVDGTRYPREDHHWYWSVPPGSSERPGRPAFPAPVATAGYAAIRWPATGEPAARWRLPRESVDRLAAAPTFDLREFTVPESVDRGSAFEAEFTVANAGDRDGRFVTEFGAGPISDHGEVTLDVPAGSERTYSEYLDPYYPDDASQVEVSLDWGCGRRSGSVSVSD